MSRAPQDPLELWVEEDQQGVLRQCYKIRKTLYSERSAYQKIDVVETVGFGRMLFNDGFAMISERDEHVYHEMISHVPLFSSRGITRVLVIGGGDGGTVREVLRHRGVERCRLVEIDGKVVEGCKRHIPQTAAALDDPRVEVTIGDGVAYVAGTDDRYDLVIVDSSDPIGPAVPLFGSEFYRNVHRVLGDNGIVVSQAESPFYDGPEQVSLLRVLRERFRRVHLYNYSNLIYPGGLWSFSFATKGDVCPVGDLDPRRIEASGLTFRYYNAEVHRAAFVLPEFQAVRLREILTPLKARAREGFTAQRPES